MTNGRYIKKNKQKTNNKENIMNKYIQNIASRLETEIKDQAK